MKKSVLIFFIFASQLCFSQDSQKEKALNFKSIKVKIICSGSFILAGAITDVVRTYQVEPTIYNSVSPEKYAQTQKDLHRVSDMLYGFGAVSLISICFEF